MLFLGTKKYPIENDFDKFVSENGGSSNAYTASDITSYFFDTSPNTLCETLDRYIILCILGCLEFITLCLLQIAFDLKFLFDFIHKSVSIFIDLLNFSYLPCLRRVGLGEKLMLSILSMRKIFRKTIGECLGCMPSHLVLVIHLISLGQVGKSE